MGRIYLDHHATTPCDPRVVEAMLPYFTQKCGNAASRSHAFGREAADAVAAAREQVADLIGASPEEIVFTSGATESDNLAIKGTMAAYRAKGDHIVTVATEHHAVLEACRALQNEGRARMTLVGVDADGLVDPAAIAAAITDQTVLVSVMAANNEVGTLQPLDEIGRLCAERGVLFHTDAAQAAGKIALNVDASGLGLVSLSAHKMYGPKGVGALYVRRRSPRVRLAPLIDGGGHEEGRRSGTLPVPLVVGFGGAAEIASREMGREAARVRGLRDRLQDRLTGELDDVKVNGHPTKRLAGNLHVSLAYVDIDALIAAMPDVAVSSGAACASAELRPSHVLRAMGVRDDLAHDSVRFGIGRFNTEQEIDAVADLVIREARRLRELSPAYANRR